MRNQITPFRPFPIVDTESDSGAQVTPMPMPGQFFSFRYSRWEMSPIGGDKTMIRQQETRFENGRLSSEQREGVVGGDLYQDAIQQMAEAQNALINHAAAMLHPFLPFSPFTRKIGRDGG